MGREFLYAVEQSILVHIPPQYCSLNFLSLYMLRHKRILPFCFYIGMIELNYENKPFFLREIMPLLGESCEIDKYLNFLYECGVTAHNTSKSRRLFQILYDFRC
jgi:hypothetical protein